MNSGKIQHNTRRVPMVGGEGGEVGDGVLFDPNLNQSDMSAVRPSQV